MESPMVVGGGDSQGAKDQVGENLLVAGISVSVAEILLVAEIPLPVVVMVPLAEKDEMEEKGRKGKMA